MRPEYPQRMARYNRWMNERLYALCADLDGDTYRADRGAFFGSIHGTLNHLLLADRVWMGRFTDQPYPVERLDQELYAEFDQLRGERARTDAAIERWAAQLTTEDLAGELRYHSLVNPQARAMPLWLAVTHFFNHQTHHRGQVTALLSQAGVDYGVTDLIALPDGG